ncbi:MAG TPA: ABC transporter ATP-binding protein [Bacteroidales bacterium]|nr:ABC transporter ATP-binding protein [Bacteroidales bacterium]
MINIKIENVTKSYGKIKAVDNLTISVEEGEIYGFIGPNGAGKSTTIRMMMNFIKADQGNITLLGLHPQKDEIQLKKQIGYVPADTFMYSDMKVNDLFKFSENFHQVPAKEKINQLVEILDIDLNKRFEQLSFGNRKKVSIACAMLHSPKLILLDEPSNGLDPVIRIKLYELLKEEQKKGVTIFFSSHVLSEVQKFCSRIGLLKNGKLIKETTVADFTNIGYRQVHIESKEEINLAALKGVAAIHKQGNSTHFMYSGNPNELIRLLNTIDIISFNIEEPDLENVFMHYFEEGKEVLNVI